MALALLAGLAAGHERSMLFAAIVLLAGGGCVVGSWLVAPRRSAGLLLLAVALCGSARSAAHEQRLAHARSVLRGDTELRFEATVDEPPTRESGEPAAVVRVRRSRPALPLGARLRLRFPAGQPIEWSDRVRGFAVVDAPEPARNPGGFDALQFSNAEGIVASGRVVWCDRFAAPLPRGWPRVTLGRLRHAIERRLDRRLSPDAREILVPLVLGDRSALPTDLYARLRVAGLVHLLALSGLHVAWLAEAVRTLAAAMGAGPAGRAIAGALCALGYVGLAGPIPSLLRAAATELLGSLARLQSKPLDSIQSLAASVIVLLIAEPGWIGDVGFQLSCTAMLGLVTLGAVRLPVRRGLARLAEPLIATVGAQVVSLPLLLSTFHLLPWVAPAANLIGVPVAGLMLSAAWIAIPLDLAVPGLGAPWFHAAEWASRAFRGCALVASRAPGAAHGVPADPVIVGLAAAGAALLVHASSGRDTIAAPARPRTSHAVVGATLCVIALLLAACSPELRPPKDRVWVVVLDVGQGDAIALGLHDGWWLIDTGARGPRFDAGESVVLPFFRWMGVRRIDTMVLTHEDGDHIGGAAAIARSMPIGRILVPPGWQAPERLSELRASGARASRAVAGDTVCHAPPIVVRWPPESAGAIAHPSAVTADNAHGVVLEIGTQARTLLLADVDSTIEARLPCTPPIALLKVAHHGAATSTSSSFLGRTRPEQAVISCGRRNRFGHPDPGVLRRLERAGARVWRTDLEGVRWFVVDARGASLFDGWRSGRAPDTSDNDARPLDPPRATLRRLPAE